MLSTAVLRGGWTLCRRISSRLSNGGPVDVDEEARNPSGHAERKLYPHTRERGPRRHDDQGGRRLGPKGALRDAGKVVEEQTVHVEVGKNVRNGTTRANRNRRNSLRESVGTRLQTRLQNSRDPQTAVSGHAHSRSHGNGHAQSSHRLSEDSLSRNVSRFSGVVQPGKPVLRGSAQAVVPEGTGGSNC